MPGLNAIDHTFLSEHNQPVAGKTYSLFGNKVTTHFFFDQVRRVTDSVLKSEEWDESRLLDYIQASNSGRKKKRGRGMLQTDLERIAEIRETLHTALQEYVTGVEEHLNGVGVIRSWRDSAISTGRDEYYFYMLEFELINRLHIKRFLHAERRIALLPHCLQKSRYECKARLNELDFKCTGCEPGCYIHHVTGLLREHGIDSYIWRSRKLKPLLKKAASGGKKLGVLGIACIPELVPGMRKTLRAGYPVIGIPLNANRCSRWMKKALPASLDLIALERLLTGQVDPT